MNALRDVVKIVAEPASRAAWATLFTWWCAHKDEHDDSQVHFLRSTDGPRSFFRLLNVIVSAPFRARLQNGGLSLAAEAPPMGALNRNSRETAMKAAISWSPSACALDDCAGLTALEAQAGFWRRRQLADSPPRLLHCAAAPRVR